MNKSAFIMRFPPGVGKGLGAAFGLLAVLNFLLLSDDVAYRYRSVFAVGRAMDKQLYLEGHPPTILVLGNSRVDNGIDPRRLAAAWNGQVSSFNDGIPGANARVMLGMLRRMDAKGGLSKGKVRAVLLGLDESFLQADESLGYVYFFGDRLSLWAAGEYRLWFGTWLRLWSFSDNLRELREPGKMQRFVSATFTPIDPVGGAASSNLGYRAGFGGQHEGQVARQELQARRQPDQAVVKCFDELLDLLQSRGIAVAVTFPPLLNRQSAYVDGSYAEGAYLRIMEALKRRSIAVLDDRDAVPRAPAYFVNVGHLNDKGAQIYTAWLADGLQAEWNWLTTRAAK